MSAREMMLVWFLLFLSPCHGDLRHVTYEDIHMDAETIMFHQSPISSFLHLIFHPSLPHLFVGSRNHVVQLQAHDLSLLQSVEWKPAKDHKKACLNKEISKGGCENYIRTLALHPEGGLLICGTYAYSPACSWRKGTNISIETKRESGLGRCPSNIHSNFTYLMSEDGDLYTALMLDTGGFDPAIVRTIGSSRPLRSEKSNSLWLDKFLQRCKLTIFEETKLFTDYMYFHHELCDAQFVAMFNIGQHVYIFFREVALEQLSCGKLVVSRVARICKSDEGGSAYVLKDSWTTFVKATLNCSRSEEYPFHYDEVQDVKYCPRRKIFTALFTTSPASLHGSAVCEYTMKQMDKSLGGPFYLYDRRRNVWKTKTSEHGRKCPSKDDQPIEDHVRQYKLMEDSQLQLSKNAIQPTEQHPIIEQSNKRYNKLEVETLKAHCPNKACHLRIIYLSTTEGVIEKFVVIPQNHTSHQHHHHTMRNHPVIKKNSYHCLIESIQLLPSDLPQSVHFLQLNPFSKQLVIGTESRVYQIPRFRCNKYPTKQKCEAAQDPHCRWEGEACRQTTHHQVASCPNRHLLAKHKFVWSGWSSCSVSCGKGVQMKIRLCLEDSNQLCSEELLDRHASKNFRSRPCHSPPCSYQNKAVWSPWLGDGNSEQRYKCQCEPKQDGCEATMVRAERFCTNSSCGSRLKRVVQKNSRSSHHLKRYHLLAKNRHSSKYVLKKNDPSQIHDHTDSKTKHKLPSTYRQNSNKKTTTPINNQKRHPSKHILRISNNIPQPCPHTCLQRTPVSMGLFYGYCGCRDVGEFRVCHKCP